MQSGNIGAWESWRRSRGTRCRKLWGQIKDALANLLPWQHTLRSIKGKRLKNTRITDSFLSFLSFSFFLSFVGPSTSSP